MTNGNKEDHSKRFAHIDVSIAAKPTPRGCKSCPPKPHLESAIEEFEWVKRQILDSGGILSDYPTVCRIIIQLQQEKERIEGSSNEN